ncbi:MAG: hypothetical protein N2645_03515 [Clostridia bacterium]|nr:hypothetical protein [Clostridia bacterium]
MFKKSRLDETQEEILKELKQLVKKQKKINNMLESLGLMGKYEESQEKVPEKTWAGQEGETVCKALDPDHPSLLRGPNMVPIFDSLSLVDTQTEFNEPGGNTRFPQQVKTKIKHYQSDFDLSKLPSGATRDMISYNQSTIPSPLDFYQWYTNTDSSNIAFGEGTNKSDLMIKTPTTAGTRYRMRFGVAWSGHNRWAWDMKIPGGYQNGHAQLHWIKGASAGACLAFNATLDGSGVWQANASKDADNVVKFSTYRVLGDGTIYWNTPVTVTVGQNFQNYRRFLLMGSINAFSLFVDHKRVAYFERNIPFSNDLVYAEFEAITNGSPALTPITQYVDYCLMEAHDNVRIESTREISLVHVSNYLQQLAESSFGNVSITSTGVQDVVSITVPTGKMVVILGFQASQTTAKTNIWQVTNSTSGTTYGQWAYQGPDVVNVDFSTPQVVGFGNEVIKLQINVSNTAAGETAYGVLRYAFV